MPYFAPDNFSYRPYIFPPFTGGYTFTQATDSDCVDYTNVEMMRDKYARSRRGAELCHTAGALGSAQFAGLIIRPIVPNSTTAGALPSVLMIMPKVGTKTFYFTDLSQYNPTTGLLGAIQTSTLPTAPPTPDPSSPLGWDFVQAVSGADKTGNSIILMAHPSWDHVVSWDGTTTAASNITASPKTCYITYHMDNRLWAITPSRTNLKFSEPGDPSTWPTENDLAISTSYGPLMALFSAPDKLLIFCQNGILSLTGNPDDDNVRVNVEHPNIGISSPQSLAYFGNTALFVFNGSVYQYSGTISLLSDAVRDSIGNGPSYPASLSDLSYIVRVPTSSGTGSDAWVFDRAHYGTWARWQYNGSSGLGSGVNYFPGIAFYGTNYYMAGADGNLYTQQHWNMTNSKRGGTISPDKSYCYVPDYNNQPVVMTVETKPVNMNDDLLTKAWRGINIYGYGSNVSVSMILFDSSGNPVTIPMMTGGTLPCELQIPAVDGTLASPVTEFNLLALRITGNYLLIKRAEIWWRPVRYSQISYSNL